MVPSPTHSPEGAASSHSPFLVPWPSQSPSIVPSSHLSTSASAGGGGGGATFRRLSSTSWPDLPALAEEDLEPDQVPDIAGETSSLSEFSHHHHHPHHHHQQQKHSYNFYHHHQQQQQQQEQSQQERYQLHDQLYDDDQAHEHTHEYDDPGHIVLPTTNQTILEWRQTSRITSSSTSSPLGPLSRTHSLNRKQEAQPSFEPPPPFFILAPRNDDEKTSISPKTKVQDYYEDQEQDPLPLSLHQQQESPSHSIQLEDLSALLREIQFEASDVGPKGEGNHEGEEERDPPFIEAQSQQSNRTPSIEIQLTGNHERDTISDANLHTLANQHPKTKMDRERGESPTSRRGGETGGLTASRPHHGLNALSPLQTLSPLTPPSGRTGSRPRPLTPVLGGSGPAMHATSSAPANAVGLGLTGNTGSPLQPLTIQNLQGWNKSNRSASPSSPRTTMTDVVNAELDSDEGDGRRSRASSVSKALSRRASLVATFSVLCELGPSKVEEKLNPGGAVSRITLVRAPSKGKSKDDPSSRNTRQRKQSIHGMSPFTIIPSSLPDEPTSTPSLAAFSSSGMPKGAGPFSLSSSYGPASPGGVTSAPGTRTSFLFGPQPGPMSGSDAPLNIHEQPKLMSPGEVVQLAESLKSPVLSDNRLPSLSRSGSYRDRNAAAAKDREREKRQQKEEELALEPVEYVEMDDDVLLPFVDRPSEVAELIQQPGNVGFFDIIHPSFPTESTGDWKEVSPEKWTWDEFQAHLMAPRAEIDDFEWIRKIRLAVRARSEAMWEKIGVCLGCDDDLLNAGEGYDVFGPGGALGEDYSGEDEIRTPQQHEVGFGYFGAEDDDDPREHVTIEGLTPTSEVPDDDSDMVIGSLEGRVASPIPLPTGSMETIGEGDEAFHSPDPPPPSRLTPAQVAGGRGEMRDPFGKSPLSKTMQLEPEEGSPTLGRNSPCSKSIRSKSIVGLQISTAPSKPSVSHVYKSSVSSVLNSPAYYPHLERGPGSPLFPSSFAQLSISPTLPRNNLQENQTRMSFTSGGRNAESFAAENPWMGLQRRKSGGGWSRVSESAITFGSEDD